MDEDYDDFDEYNDAADDWELEAEEKEALEKEIIKQKADFEEQKILKRVKAPKRETEEKEETLAEDIMQALRELKEKASSAGEALSLVGTDDSTSSKLIADMPVNTADEATALGEAIAVRVLKFAGSPHFSAMISSLFQDLAHEFKSRNTLNAEASKVHVASEEARRRLKKVKKKEVGRHDNDGVANKDATGENDEQDVLKFNTLDDREAVEGNFDPETDLM